MVSVPSSMIASRLLAPIGVATLRGARGVGVAKSQPGDVPRLAFAKVLSRTQRALSFSVSLGTTW